MPLFLFVYLIGF